MELQTSLIIQTAKDTSKCCENDDDGIEKPSTTTKRIGTDGKVINSSTALEKSLDGEEPSSQRKTRFPKS
jgi:hypothetical protein